MRAFVIEQGTAVYVVREDRIDEPMQRFHTTKKNMFFLEDMAVDPLGIVNHPDMVDIPNTHQSDDLTSQGCYVFYRDGWFLYAMYDDVTVG